MSTGLLVTLRSGKCRPLMQVTVRHLSSLPSNEEDSALRKQFEEWAVKYNRVYKSVEEKEKRFNAFKETTARIEAHHKAGHSHTVGYNHLSDVTIEEFNKMLLRPKWPFRRRRRRRGPE